MSHVSKNYWLDEYWNMVSRWKAVAAQPMPDDEKTATCLAILRQHIDRVAVFYFKKPSSAIRFYTEMLLLREHLSTRSAFDEFGKLIIRPAHRHVDEWLRANVQAKRCG